MKSNVNEILQGPAQDKLKELEPESVDCCITSPPYWSLRDYKTEGQLGLESTFQEYITKLIEIFNQVKRVLKKEGSCWVNMGDTYNGNKTGNTNGTQRGNPFMDRPVYAEGIKNESRKQKVSSIPEKSLCLIPERFAIAMVDEGWILRNKIIWYKPNCMPSSAKDRFTVDWEYLFFFTKSQRYWFETQYEPYGETERWGGNKMVLKPNGKLAQNMNASVRGDRELEWHSNPLGRIKRCVWKIPTAAFSEAHFATFPPAIVKTPLKATCPEYICKRCGKAREKIIEKAIDYKASTPYGKYNDQDKQMNAYRAQSNLKTLRDLTGIHEPYFLPKQTGLTDCGCNAGFDGGLVLDPFMGAGTVALVAMQNARNFIGCELNQSYIDMAMERLRPYLLQTRLPI